MSLRLTTITKKEIDKMTKAQAKMVYSTLGLQFDSLHEVLIYLEEKIDLEEAKEEQSLKRLEPRV